VFSGPGAGVVASEFGFAVYAIAAQAAGANFTVAGSLPAGSQMPRGHDLPGLAAVIDGSTRLVYLANPNNPTATWFDTASLQQFLERVPANVLVLVDEAYIEYASVPGLASAIPLIGQHPNLVVTRTFSKAYGLAGLRAGYACAHPGLLAVLERARESFNVNAVALAACEAALADVAHLENIRAMTAVERDWLASGLLALGITVSPSQANFLLVDFGRDAKQIEVDMLGRGVVLRPMGGYGLPTCLRITVGPRADNERLLAALGEVLG
jgi:histidinol-phosphate aminotransferase